MEVEEEQNKTLDIKKYHQEYYKEHKQERLAYFKAKVVCQCGAKLKRTSITRHVTSKKHATQMLNIGVNM